MGALVLGKCAIWTAKPPSGKPSIGMIRDLRLNGVPEADL
jgi:hypothetical protein